MNPQTTSAIAGLWVLVGLAADLIMLEIQGNPKKRAHLKGLTFVHRALGVLFILVYIAALLFMVIRIAFYHQELALRPLIHACLALSLLPMFGLKWLIVRRFNRFFSYLPVLGSLILATALVSSAMSAGHVFLYASKIRYTEPSEADVYEVHLARGLLFTKCGKCHSLEPVLRAANNREGWIKTVNRMAQKDLPNIRPFEMKQLILYLIRSEEGRDVPVAGIWQDLSGKDLVQAKCTACHKLDRIYGAPKDMEFWNKTIDTMIHNAEEIGMINFLNDREKQELLRFLTEKK
jgi:hypothetical protein